MGMMKKQLDVAVDEFTEKLAIRAASRLIKESLECGIITDKEEALFQYDRMVEDFRTQRTVDYLLDILEKGLEAVIPLKHRDEEEFI